MAAGKRASPLRHNAKRRGEVVARSRVFIFRAIPSILERFKVPPEPILAMANLTREDLEDPELTASFPDLDRMLGASVRESGCGHFGLLIGRTIDLQSFGIAGRLARFAPSVGAALDDVCAYFQLHDNGGSPFISVNGSDVTFSYEIHAPGVRNADLVYDMAACAMLNILRQFCGSLWRPRLVLLPRKRPPDLRPYREAFGAPLHFDAMRAGMVFDRSWLSQPVKDADSMLHDMIEERASAVIGEEGPQLHGEVLRAIKGLLSSRRCSRADVARRLGMHERTLGRRLLASGTTYQVLLDEVRSQWAIQLLRDTRAPVARIAATMGYRDSTVFTRAFRRWTGLTPRQFRAGPAPQP